MDSREWNETPLADPAEDFDPPSGLLDSQVMTARCLVGRGALLAPLRAGMAKTGLRVEEVRTPEDMLRAPFPQLAVVDMSALEASVTLASLAQREPRCWTLALAQEPALEAEALCAGAEVVLRTPLDADVVALQLERLRERIFQKESARQSTERETSKARAESIAEFARAVTQEIFEPLNVTAINVRLLREMLLQAPAASDRREVAELAADTAEAVERLHRVMAEVRNFVRADSRPLEPVRLSDIVEEAIWTLPNPARVPIEVGIISDERAVARRELLERVVDHLLANALKAVEDRPTPRVLVRVYRHAGEPRISVRDNGTGVPTELRDRIFQPFFRPLDGRFRGVGLALCREFVARMGGALTLAPGNDGSCFRIRLQAP